MTNRHVLREPFKATGAYGSRCDKKSKAGKARDYRNDSSRKFCLKLKIGLIAVRLVTIDPKVSETNPNKPHLIILRSKEFFVRIPLEIK